MKIVMKIKIISTITTTNVMMMKKRSSNKSMKLLRVRFAVEIRISLK